MADFLDILALGSISMIVVIATIALLLLIATFVFWIWMLIDCLKRKENQFPNKETNDKIFWSLIIFFTYLIGAILYYFIVKKKKQEG